MIPNLVLRFLKNIEWKGNWIITKCCNEERYYDLNYLLLQIPRNSVVQVGEECLYLLCICKIFNDIKKQTFNIEKLCFTFSMTLLKAHQGMSNKSSCYRQYYNFHVLKDTTCLQHCKKQVQNSNAKDYIIGPAWHLKLEVIQQESHIFRKERCHSLEKV